MGTSQINARGAQQAAIVGKSQVTPKPAEHKKDADLSHLSYDFGNMPLHATAQGGNHMDKHTQSSMSQHFGTDFGGVKIHTDDHAVNLNRQFNARAFTVNNNIYFNEGEYKPETREGQHLLAHELVHTIQQGSASTSGIQAKSIVDRPDSVHEREADSIANSFTQAQDSGYRSSALQMRSNMGITPLANPAIQRVPTSGGEWTTTKYENEIDKDQAGNATPVAWGMRGLDIDLKFTPNDKVDADLIGLSQSVQSFVSGAATFPDDTKKKRAISSGDAKAIDTGKGETDEGTAIDQADYNRNPLYAAEKAPNADVNLSDTAADNFFGQHGFNSKAAGKQDAKLHDTPRRSNAQKNSRQIFEVTALAIKGAQTGTYYGSVRWGWRTDDKGVFSKIDPITVVSEGVPSSTFLKAAKNWNASKTSTGAETLDLPTVDVQVTTKTINEVPSSTIKTAPMSPLTRSIPSGTRVQLIFMGASSVSGDKLPQIKVLSGLFIGTVLTISVEDMSSLKAERT